MNLKSMGGGNECKHTLHQDFERDVNKSDCFSAEKAWTHTKYVDPVHVFA